MILSLDIPNEFVITFLSDSFGDFLSNIYHDVDFLKQRNISYSGPSEMEFIKMLSHSFYNCRVERVLHD